MSQFKTLSPQEAQRLFSKERICSYESVTQHFENFALIGSISENLGIAEVLLRNKIDRIISQNDVSWLDYFCAELDLRGDKNLSKHKLISMQSLGFWLKVIDEYKIHNQLFSCDFLENLNFRRYYTRNTNRFQNGNRLRLYHKAKLLAYLLRNLRNRAFHFENLYKCNENNQPRLNACVKSGGAVCIMHLESSRIQTFLNDLICELSKEVEKKGGGKGSALNYEIIYH